MLYFSLSSLFREKESPAGRSRRAWGSRESQCAPASRINESRCRVRVKESKVKTPLFSSSPKKKRKRGEMNISQTFFSSLMLSPSSPSPPPWRALDAAASEGLGGGGEAAEGKKADRSRLKFRVFRSVQGIGISTFPKAGCCPSRFRFFS